MNEPFPRFAISWSCALLALLLTACAADAARYAPPRGVPQAQMQADKAACREESGIERLREDRELLEQQCMFDRGYTLDRS